MILLYSNVLGFLVRDIGSPDSVFKFLLLGFKSWNNLAPPLLIWIISKFLAQDNDFPAFWLVP